MSFRVRDQPKDTESPREVGEIDTRAPFQSVKAAVSLFGEVVVPKERRSIKRRSSENVLEKETQLLLAQRELNKIRKQLEGADNTRSKALSELDKANVTLQELTKKLNSVRESKRSAIEAAEVVKNQAKELEHEYDPELTQNLEAKLSETNEEIQVLQEHLKQARESDTDSVRQITLEIKEATKTLQEVAEEESYLRNLVDSLRTELEQVKKEQEELKEKEKAAEAHAENLTDQLQNRTEETSSVVEKESDEKELEKKLELYLKQAKEAKAAEQRAIEEMKMMSDLNAAETVSTTDVNGKIVLTVDEFAALSGKIKESEDLIERTETAAIAQVESINTRKNEVDRKVEANLKAIEEIKAATDMALRNAEMADSAKDAVEGELKKWREDEQNMEYSDNSSRSISLRI
uniref:Laminin subunit alpha-2 n=1 Tax=Cajanus cajan TaxID=3821 RepID=A0A151T6Z1_CAJCA|nr:Laminin subunit alpha-2 [Cajanus cajan]